MRFAGSFASVGVAAVASFLLVACGQKDAPKPKPTVTPAVAPKIPTLKESIVETGKREGKPQWDVDCDLAFVGDLEAARRVREILLRLPFAQQSQRTQMCGQVAHTTIEKGGW